MNTEDYKLSVERQTIYDERTGRDMGEATVLIPQFQPSKLPDGVDRLYESIREMHWKRPGMIILKDEFEPEFEVGEQLTIMETIRRHREAMQRIKETIIHVFESLKEILGPALEEHDGYDELNELAEE